MSDLNKVLLVGRLTKAPELQQTGGGSTVCNISVANTRTYNVQAERKEYTSFFNCQAWGKLAETISKYCVKGQQIAVDGRLQQRTWTDKQGNKRSSVDIVIDAFQFLSKPNGAKQEEHKSEPEQTPLPAWDDPSLIPPGEDVPF
jgi:single-strand DNA-binding protein